MNFNLPLQKSLHLSDGNGGSTEIQIKYENLSSFCYYCCVLGHVEEECEAKVDDELNHRPLNASMGFFYVLHLHQIDFKICRVQMVEICFRKGLFTT